MGAIYPPETKLLTPKLGGQNMKLKCPKCDGDTKFEDSDYLLMLGKKMYTGSAVEYRKCKNCGKWWAIRGKRKAIDQGFNIEIIEVKGTELLEIL